MCVFFLVFFYLMSRDTGNFSMKMEADYRCVCVCVCEVICWYESNTKNNYVVNWI